MLRSALRLSTLFLTTAMFATAQDLNIHTPQEGHEVAMRRAAALSKGINTSGWFSGWGDYSEEHTRSWTTANDLQAIHRMGFTYIRFGMDPAIFSRHALNSPDAEAIWKRIDAAVDTAMDAHLMVMFVVFPNDEYKQQLATQRGADQFIALWVALAQHFAARDPERFFFELMNEPEVQDPYRWIGLQNAAIAAIRKTDRKHTIIATAAHYSGLDDLLVVEPSPDTNVIYNFHFYEPYPFTHQGATWGSSEWPYFKNIPYPATVEQITEISKTIADDHARYILYLYGSGGWNEQSFRDRLAFAADWAKERNLPLICNEFGAFRDTAPLDSRARFLQDVRVALEKNGIGWAMWDYRGNFGLVTHHGSDLIVDPNTLKALGMNMP
jgi:endoglucanase